MSAPPPNPVAAAALDRGARSGIPKPTLLNTVKVLDIDPKWSGHVRLNEFKGTIELRGDLKSDADEIAIAVDLELRYDLVVSTKRVFEALAHIAKQNAYHPVREYLAGLTWDGTARCNRLIPDYFAGEDNALTQAYGLRWMVAGVARIFSPGCKADNMLVLQGGQGAGKSTGLAALAVDPDWFSDNELRLGSKEAVEGIQGVWIKEIAELQGIRGRAATEVKAFLSMQVDKFRPAYGRNVVEVPRQCVFASSTNEDTFLIDDSGSRRFWPVTVGRVDVERIRADRDQLWAEAVHRYQAGEQWHLTREEDALRVEDAGRFEQSHPWEPLVAEWVLGKGQFTTAEVLQGAIEKRPEHWTRRDEMQMASVLKGLGFESKQTRINGRKARRWAAKEED